MTMGGFVQWSLPVAVWRLLIHRKIVLEFWLCGMIKRIASVAKQRSGACRL